MKQAARCSICTPCVQLILLSPSPSSSLPQVYSQSMLLLTYTIVSTCVRNASIKPHTICVCCPVTGVQDTAVLHWALSKRAVHLHVAGLHQLVQLCGLLLR